jgi:ribonuclease HI
VRSAGSRLTVFTDGAARGNPGPAGAAALVFDDAGALVEEVLCFLGEATNNVAEYRALLLGLGKARSLGGRTVEVLTDSELLAKQWNGVYRVKNRTLRSLYEEAKEAADDFEAVKVRHVRREENIRADAAANRAIDEAAGAGAPPHA